MPKIRFGVRYTTDENKDLAYLQLQKDNDIDFARPGELFINEPLNKVYCCDSSTNQFVELNPSALDQLTPEDIKTLYELNPDTNAFTDALKDKAEQAVDKAEANERDIANRDRTNHTGTQTAATISNFDTEVSNNTDVAANTAARHDAVTVVDSSEIDFTLTGQQITASIVAGSIDESKLDASVNASLDLADSSVQLTGDQSIAGTKTFTTALILPNNSRINGVEHFYQTTKPEQRGDLSALVAGDRWWKTGDGTEWFWNGTYWLSGTTYSLEQPSLTRDAASITTAINVTQTPGASLSSSTGAGTDVGFPLRSNIFWVDSFSLLTRRATLNSWTVDTNNSFQIWPALIANGDTAFLSSAILINSVSQFLLENNNWHIISGPVNQIFDLSSYGQVVVRPRVLSRWVNGTPTAGDDVRFMCSIFIRHVYQ